MEESEDGTAEPEEQQHEEVIQKVFFSAALDVRVLLQ